MNLEVGTVFRWNNFPFQKYGSEVKARWFVCVGSSGLFAQIAMVYLCTTTTQTDKFKGGGNRCNHSHFKFEISQFPEFEEDCVIDFDEKPYSMEKNRLLSYKDDIETRGKLNDNILRMVYKRLQQSGLLSYVEKCDIYDSFNRCGITGLKRPKR